MCGEKNLPEMLRYVTPTRDNALRLAADERLENMRRKQNRKDLERWETK